MQTLFLQLSMHENILAGELMMQIRCSFLNMNRYWSYIKGSIAGSGGRAHYFGVELRWKKKKIYWEVSIVLLKMSELNIYGK